MHLHPFLYLSNSISSQSYTSAKPIFLVTPLQQRGRISSSFLLPPPLMGRKKIPIKKIQDEPKLQITYSKRKSGLVKKSYEIALMSGVDVAFISFSQAGTLCFFSNGIRIEDVFERYINSRESKQKHSRAGQEQILKILSTLRCQSDTIIPQDMGVTRNSRTKILQQQILKKQEELMAALSNLRKFEADDAETITSLHEIESRERFLVDALQRLSHKKTQNWLGRQSLPLMGDIEGKNTAYPNGAPLNSTSWKVNWMQKTPSNLRLTRSLFTSIYDLKHHGFGQHQVPLLLDKASSTSSNQPPSESSASTGHQNILRQDTLTEGLLGTSNPSSGQGMPMPISCDEDLAYFSKLVEHSSFNKDLEF